MGKIFPPKSTYFAQRRVFWRLTEAFDLAHVRRASWVFLDARLMEEKNEKFCPFLLSSPFPPALFKKLGWSIFTQGRRLTNFEKSTYKKELASDTHTVYEIFTDGLGFATLKIMANPNRLLAAADVLINANIIAFAGKRKRGRRRHGLLIKGSSPWRLECIKKPYQPGNEEVPPRLHIISHNQPTALRERWESEER